jgi:hypothetical protein
MERMLLYKIIIGTICISTTNLVSSKLATSNCFKSARQERCGVDGKGVVGCRKKYLLIFLRCLQYTLINTQPRLLLPIWSAAHEFVYMNCTTFGLLLSPHIHPNSMSGYDSRPTMLRWSCNRTGAWNCTRCSCRRENDGPRYVDVG